MYFVFADIPELCFKFPELDTAGAGTIDTNLHYYQHLHYLNSQHLHHERRQPLVAGWAAGYPEAAQLPEDAIAGRVGSYCA